MFVAPVTPADAPPIFDIFIVPELVSLALAALIVRAAKALELPIVPDISTAPDPELIVNASLFPPLVSKAAPKVTSPLPVPVLIVVVPSLARSTPEVLKATLSPVVVKAALLPVISILPPPVTAV